MSATSMKREVHYLQALWASKMHEMMNLKT